MTRKRVRMELISHEPTRLATFKKRKASILKKASELSILCAVPVCVIVSDGINNAKPEIWPQSDQASDILSRFNSLSQSEKTKKMLDKEGFISQQVAKRQMQLEKIQRENQNLKAQLLLKNLLSRDCSIADVQDAELVTRLQKIGCKRTEQLLSAQMVQAPSADESFGKDEILDFDEASFQLAETSHEIFNSVGVEVSLPDWCVIEKEMSELLDRSHKKDGIFESSTTDLVSEFARQYEKEDETFEEKMRLLDTFGDCSSYYGVNQDIADILPSF